MQAIVLVIHLVLAIALVAVILMQRSEGGALSGMGGGGGGGGGLGDFMSARGATNFLTRLTTILAAAFMLTSLLLTVLAAGQHSDTAPLIQDNRMVPQEAPAEEQPAAPSVPFSE